MWGWIATRDPLAQQNEFLPVMRSIFEYFGVGGLSRFLLQSLTLVFALLMAWCVDLFSRRWLVRGVHALVKRTETKWDDALMEHHVFERLAHLAPALVLWGASQVIFPSGAWGRSLLQHVAVSIIILVVVWALEGAVDAFLGIFRSMEGMRYKPLESYGQVIKLLLGSVAAVLIVAEFLERSPWALLGGLGAFTAVLILVFRDSILGFVASVQISTLDLVREGDWIEMPKYEADGSVIRFSLTTVHVQNWDKTITTIPTYALTGESFKNWRGMFDSGVRRIKRAVSIDINSVRFLDEALLAEMKKIQLLQPYLDKRLAEITAWNAEHKVESNSPANGRRLTNIGTFRAYLEAYMEQHPKIDTQMTFLIRQLPPSANGLPIEIYVFTREQSWVPYEKLIADIFDHLFAILPLFDLRAFQAPNGADVRALLHPPAPPAPRLFLDEDL